MVLLYNKIDNYLLFCGDYEVMAISYQKMNKVLEQKEMTMAELRKAAEIAPNTMTRIRKNEEVSLDVLGRICHVLNVDFGDIMEYLPERE